MRDELIIEALFACGVAAFVLRDGLKRGRISGGHIAICIFTSLGIFAAPAAWNPRFGGGRCTAPKNACINNLRQIDGAKEQWALENHIESGKPSIDKEIDAYLKGGRPKCPQGGTYTYGKVDEPPRCSIKDHTLQ